VPEHSGQDAKNLLSSSGAGAETTLQRLLEIAGFRPGISGAGKCWKEAETDAPQTR
jgi:hypothetical protein